MKINVILFQGFTYVAPSVLEEMQQPRIVTARSPRRNPRNRNHVFPQQSTQNVYQNCNVHPHHRLQQFSAVRQTPPHLQGFAPRPSPGDDMMEGVQQGQGLPIV